MPKVPNFPTLLTLPKVPNFPTVLIVPSVATVLTMLTVPMVLTTAGADHADGADHANDFWEGFRKYLRKRRRMSVIPFID